MIRLSLGQGRTDAQGELVTLEGDTSNVRMVAGWLASLTPALEAWWSPHTWEGSYRTEAGWESACAAVIDIDHTSNPKECPLAPEDDVNALCAVVRAGDMPGNLFHLTPHGGRVILVFDAQSSDLESVRSALRGACELVAKALPSSYKVDTGTSCDVARFFYTPNAIAKGVNRTAHIVTMRADAFALADLAPVAAPVTGTLVPTRSPNSDYQDAVAKFNDEHPLDVKRHSDTCPVCEHNGCFGVLPKDKQRWFCWSTNHTVVGIRSERGWHGDALDLYAHEKGIRPIDVLIREGYLKRREPVAPTGDAPQLLPRRGIYNNSFDSACTVLTKEAYPTDDDGETREIIPGRKQIRFNEMTGCIEFGYWDDQDPSGRDVKEIRDVDVDIIRRRVETLYPGGIDKNGNQTGLKMGRDLIERALAVVADEHAYHPVRDYLSSLAWDCVPRIDRVAKEILGAEDTKLNRTLIRKTLISAVARAFDPGCKVDTMLVLQGKQGAKKSSFFRAIAHPWFIDTPIDISADATRAYQVMRRAWIFEWAELETLLKARDLSTVKAFLSSPEDTYIAKYGRHPIVVKRSGIVAGSINPMHFLEDDTGSRRIWPMRVAARIRLDLARSWRDALWAEAVTLYREWVSRGRNDDECPWWLTNEEDAELRVIHDEHRVGDVWEDAIIPWADSQTDPFTTGRVLDKALDKPSGQWNRGDEMRVSKILKMAGYEKRSHGDDRAKKWSRVEAQTSLPIRVNLSQPESTSESTEPY
jgi:hypothetical protein